jgi:hypothetical protein
VGDQRLGGVGGGDLADQQVRVGGARLEPATLTQPLDGQGVGELVEVDGVTRAVAHQVKSSGGQVQVGQQKVVGLLLAESVDGDCRSAARSRPGLPRRR